MEYSTWTRPIQAHVCAGVVGQQPRRGEEESVEDPKRKLMAIGLAEEEIEVLDREENVVGEGEAGRRAI